MDASIRLHSFICPPFCLLLPAQTQSPRRHRGERRGCGGCPRGAPPPWGRPRGGESGPTPDQSPSGATPELAPAPPTRPPGRRPRPGAAVKLVALQLLLQSAAGAAPTPARVGLHLATWPPAPPTPAPPAPSAAAAPRGLRSAVQLARQRCAASGLPMLPAPPGSPRAAARIFSPGT